MRSREVDVTSPIDTAYVTIAPKLDQFEGETRRGLDEAFSGVDPTVRELVNSIERQFEELTQSLRSEFESISTYADVAFEGMHNASVEAADSMTLSMDRAAESIEVAMDTVTRKVDEDFDKMAVHGKESATKVGGSSKSFLGSAALFGGVAAIGVGLEELTKSGLQSAASVEQLKISFQSLTGSVAAGNKQFQDLMTFAAQTPFQMSDVQVAAQRFDAFAKSVGIAQD